MNLLERGQQWLNEQRHAHMATEVTYARSKQTVTLNATIGRTEFEVNDQYGGLIRSQARDFIVRTEDLVLGGEPTLPQRGDRIIETIDGRTYTHEVMSVMGDLWKYGDEHRHSLRIHTRHIDTEPASP